MPLSQSRRRPYVGPMRASVDSDDLNVVESESSHASAGERVEKGFYLNPILDEDFPDPAVIQTPDGYYYAYATQTLRDGHWLNIQVARSKDLIHWEQLGDALPKKPDWAQHTQDFWAPSVIFDGSMYFMYYSATPDAS